MLLSEALTLMPLPANLRRSGGSSLSSASATHVSFSSRLSWPPSSARDSTPSTCRTEE
jgi:hypothetical protein